MYEFGILQYSQFFVVGRDVNRAGPKRAGPGRTISYSVSIPGRAEQSLTLLAIRAENFQSYAVIYVY